MIAKCILHHTRFAEFINNIKPFILPRRWHNEWTNKCRKFTNKAIALLIGMINWQWRSITTHASIVSDGVLHWQSMSDLPGLFAWLTCWSCWWRQSTWNNAPLARYECALPGPSSRGSHCAHRQTALRTFTSGYTGETKGLFKVLKKPKTDG